MTLYRVRLSYEPRSFGQPGLATTWNVVAPDAKAAVLWAMDGVTAVGSGRLVIAVTPDE